MNSGKTIFAQLMDFVPIYEFRKCVDRYNGNHKVIRFSCWDQHLCMAFAKFTYRESLRGNPIQLLIEQGLSMSWIAAIWALPASTISTERRRLLLLGQKETSDEHVSTPSPSTKQTLSNAIRWSCSKDTMRTRIIRKNSDEFADFDSKNEKTLVFLTNNFALPAITIANLYRCRWQVELFLKWIKQHLRIKAFYGTTEKAV